MDVKGINYDTGTRTLTGGSTRVDFDLDVVSREIDIIKNELHCTAIRISGFDMERVRKASEIALKKALNVWFSPSLQYETLPATRNYIIEGAKVAEQLRADFPGVVFVVASELTLFAGGFVKGDSGTERLRNLFGPLNLIRDMLGIRHGYNRRLNSFMIEVVKSIREAFHGEITYASGAWEKVNWELFDITGVDFYRSSLNRSTFPDELRNYKKSGKRLSVMEFGCCTYRGAEDKGAMGWAIIDWKNDKPKLKGDYTRDEDIQSNYLLELLSIFETEQVFASFVFTFISYNYVFNDDPRYDLDMGSYGIVKSIPPGAQGYSQGLHWLPKKAFFALADYYSNH